MNIIEYEYQTKAENELKDFILQELDSDEPRNQDNNILLYSCVGSGKTKMLDSVIQQIPEEYEEDVAFIYLTLSTGELHKQTLESLRKYEGENVEYIDVDDLILKAGSSGVIPKNTCTVIGWDSINKTSSNRMKDGEETANLSDILRINKERSETDLPVPNIIVIIDEAHRNNTTNTDEICEKINPSVIVLSTATPKYKESKFQTKYKVEVEPSDVAKEGKIKSQIIINDSDQEDDYVGKNTDWESLIEAGLKRREMLQNHYNKIGADVTPLVIIQIPNDKASYDYAKENVDKIKDILKKLNVKDNDILVWTAKENTIKDLDVNKSRHTVLITKLAVSTGWDCPRAEILVKLRDVKSEELNIQTLGRIYRTADVEQWEGNEMYKNDDILNSAWVYTTDAEFDTTCQGLKILDPKFRVEVKPEFKEKIEGIKLVREVAGPKHINKLKVEKRDEFINQVIDYFNEVFPYAYPNGKYWNCEATIKRPILKTKENTAEILKRQEDKDKDSRKEEYVVVPREEVEKYCYTRLRDESRIKAFANLIEEAIRRHVVNNLLDDDYKENGRVIKPEIQDFKIQDLCSAILINWAAFIFKINVILDEYQGYQSNMKYEGQDEKHPLWTPKLYFYESKDLKESVKNYAYDKISDRDSKQEYNFEKAILEEYMDVWFKNDRSSDSFQITRYEKDNIQEKAPRRFFPDYIALKEDTLYILEVKGTVKNTGESGAIASDEIDATRAKAIHQWLADQDLQKSINASTSFKRVVFGIVRRNLSDKQWKIYCGDGDTKDYSDQASENWRSMVDIIKDPLLFNN